MDNGITYKVSIFKKLLTMLVDYYKADNSIVNEIRQENHGNQIFARIVRVPWREK